MALCDYRIVRLIQRVRRDGLGSAAVLACKNLPRPLYGWLIRRRLREHERFDARYEVDTQMPVPVSDLEVAAPGARFANRYEGTPITAFRKIIRRLKVDPTRFTFIDLGSGKGRVLLIAAEYRFKSVLGVEFSKKLHDIAVHNIAKFANSSSPKTSAVSINCDAGEFDFSGLGNTIVFCYNPFGADVMTRVLDNLQASAGRDGETTIFIYLGPMPPAVTKQLNTYHIIGKGEFLSEFGFFEQYSIYQISGGAFERPGAQGQSGSAGRG